jgi:hypothetical protein
MPPHVAGSVAFQVFVIQPAPVPVQREEFAAIRRGPVVALVDRAIRRGRDRRQRIAAGGELASVKRGARLGPARCGVEVVVIRVLLAD